MLKRGDETDPGVNAKKRRIGQSAAKPRTGERSTTIPEGSTGGNPGKRQTLYTMKKIRIYILSDPTNGEIKYVGKTHFTLGERLAKHMIAKENPHKVDWIKSLQEKGLRPEIELLEEVDKKDWISKEKEWIKTFTEWGFKLLNIQKGGKGGVISGQCRKRQNEYLKTDEAKLNIKRMQERSKESTSRKVLQFDKKGNFLKEFPSVSEAARTINGSIAHISGCCNRKPKRLSHKGFMWKYKDEDIV